jgi:hypothetical protein
MRVTRCRYVAGVLLSGCFAAMPMAHAASDEAAKSQSAKPQPAGQAPQQTFAQVVRLSYVEGDVRIARGKVSEKSSGSDWEMAVAGLPIETGYNLVTGNGRAEIELEDASTVYLADNSVLAFNDLHTTGGIPNSTLALLSGTATVHVNRSSGDKFILMTPTAHLVAGSSRQDTYIRLTAYADGFAIARRGEDTVMRLPDSSSPVPQAAGGNTFYVREGVRIAAPEGSGSQSFAEWDKWVDERLAARATATNAVMKEAGLAGPLPGLADMYGKGTFFSCAPYGTCWEPNETPAAAQHDPDQHDPAQPAASSLNSAPQPAALRNASLSQDSPANPTKNPSGKAATRPAKGRSPGPDDADDLSFFPCMPVQGGRAGSIDQFGMTYDWTRCHAGFWIHNRRGYAWVVGRRIHHHRPVKWVKYGRETAFVPSHPKDEPGKLPLNREHGVFVVKDKDGEPVHLAEYDAKQEMKPLNSEPKEFLKPEYAPLERATTPHPEVRAIATPAQSVLKPDLPKPNSEQLHASLVFDHKSQSFLLVRQVNEGGRIATVRQPFEGRNGTLQARVAGVDSHGNYSMRASGGTDSYGGSRDGGGGSSGGGHAGGRGGSGGSHASRGGGGGGGGRASGGGGHR